MKYRIKFRFNLFTPGLFFTYGHLAFDTLIAAQEKLKLLKQRHATGIFEWKIVEVK